MSAPSIEEVPWGITRMIDQVQRDLTDALVTVPSNDRNAAHVQRLTESLRNLEAVANLRAARPAPTEGVPLDQRLRPVLEGAIAEGLTQSKQALERQEITAGSAAQFAVEHALNYVDKMARWTVPTPAPSGR